MFFSHVIAVNKGKHQVHEVSLTMCVFLVSLLFVLIQPPLERPIKFVSGPLHLLLIPIQIHPPQKQKSIRRSKCLYQFRKLPQRPPVSSMAFSLLTETAIPHYHFHDHI